jgi:hypothetical protein
MEFEHYDLVRASSKERRWHVEAPVRASLPIAAEAEAVDPSVAFAPGTQT